MLLCVSYMHTDLTITIIFRSLLVCAAAAVSYIRVYNALSPHAGYAIRGTIRSALSITRNLMICSCPPSKLYLFVRCQSKNIHGVLMPPRAGKRNAPDRLSISKDAYKRGAMACRV